MKNKKYFVAILALMSLFFAGGNILAQTASAEPSEDGYWQLSIVSTIGISGQKIVSQNGSNVKFSFDISNGPNIQPDIRYAVKLVEGEGLLRTVVDEKTYEKVVSLSADEKKHEELIYQVPSFLKGNYQLFIVGHTSSGMEMVEELVGNISLKGNGEYLKIIPESCNLIVKGNETEIYAVNQGVDIKPEETLVARCYVENNFKNGISASAHLTTYYRTSLGEKVAEEESKKISFSAGNAGPVPFIVKLPKVSEPQAYDCVLNFRDEQNRIISNAMPFHYVLRGVGATIHNVRLDKNSYSQGDMARVLIDMTPSADSFDGSRFGPTDTGQMFLDVMIKDGQGQECSRLDNWAISQEDIKGTINLSMSVDKNCLLPKVSAKVKAKDGRVLALQNYFIGQDSDKEAILSYNQGEKSVAEKSFSKQHLLLIILAFFVLIPAMVIMIYVIRNRKRKAGLTVLIFFLISGYFSIFNSAEAKTEDPVILPGINATVSIAGGYDNQGHYINKSIYNIGLNKSEFHPGEMITAQAAVKEDASCANGGGVSGARVAIDGYPERELFYNQFIVNYYTEVTSKIFAIEDCPYNSDLGMKDMGIEAYPCVSCDSEGDCFFSETCSGGYYFDPNNLICPGCTNDSLTYKYKGSSDSRFFAYPFGKTATVTGYYKGAYEPENYHYIDDGVYSVTYVDNDNSKVGFDECRVGGYASELSRWSAAGVFEVKPPVGNKYAKFDLVGIGSGSYASFGHYFWIPYLVTDPVPSSTFNLGLQINKIGEGSGSVNFSPANGSACAANCNKAYSSGTVVNMTASTSNGSEIKWDNSQCDSVSGNTCRVTMNASRNVPVTFSKSIPSTPVPSVEKQKSWKEVAP